MQVVEGIVIFKSVLQTSETQRLIKKVTGMVRDFKKENCIFKTQFTSFLSPSVSCIWNREMIPFFKLVQKTDSASASYTFPTTPSLDSSKYIGNFSNALRFFSISALLTLVTEALVIYNIKQKLNQYNMYI